VNLGIAGRRAVVAAASSGLGYACAEALVAEGVHVAVGGHDAERIQAAAERLGNGTVAITTDLTVPERAALFVDDAAAALGGLDILVANGPGPTAGNFATTAAAAYPAALELSLLSVVQMVYAAVPHMRLQHWGRIVAITSISVRQPIPNLILSNTARAGTTGFLKTVAREIAAEGITVNSVLPGLHETQRVTSVYGDGIDAAVSGIPARALGRPADLGAVVAFLCSDQARYVTGSALAVDGGSDAALI
jgi:3-oxoacyl-[acyl-carrier protein] reductase